ncbi:CotO family spore coat protein [Lederbergia wuyishanensis]|uniref:Spore coat protein CotO n=1 Tax=Lederbergia wuyishanensis TaxID=1347903 RepID=A0ABU0CZ12_9BACI|nr:CotO family spore coat protein [Lederbergia wuyishanensis]MCJ8006014.1 spore coat CotO family protein [Lederbergia wuyishanensis]MDQ0341381.1 hypothetical protein [Lederbergia wuyishanensis]
MENKNEGNKEEPLLYIHQPKFNKPGRSMQDHYLSEDLPEEVQVDRNLTQNRQKKHLFTLPPLENEKVIEVVEEIQEEAKNETQNETEVETQGEVQEENQGEEKKTISAADYFRRNAATTKRKSWNLTPVKTFRDMSIPEKLQYLSGFPSSQQPYSCEFITEKEQYRGTLSKYDNNQIFVKNFQGDIEEVDVKDLQAIKIIL